MNMLCKPRFSLGQILATPGAIEALEESGQEPTFFLAKHVQGEWGDLCEGDRKLNEEALIDGSRIMSSYKTLKGIKLWVITDAVDEAGNRYVTTILLPEEY